MENKLLISYLSLRRIIGILALAFPFLLILGVLCSGEWPYPPSLSQSYWTNAGVLFSSMLVTFGLFLLAYKGYDKTDRIITAISGSAMIIVALFPCEGGDSYLLQFIPAKITAVIHYLTAAVAFSLMGVMSFFMFTLGESGTKKKKLRNLIYRICGGIIFAMVLLMLILQVFDLRPVTDGFRLFWWTESAVVLSFGVSWLIKGEVILRDG